MSAERPTGEPFGGGAAAARGLTGVRVRSGRAATRRLAAGGSPAGEQRGGLFASFREPRYRRLWFSAVLFGLGIWAERIAVGWYVLDTTGSVLLTALSYAVLSVPNLIVGPIAGAVADRFPRGKILMWTAVGRAGAAVTIGVIALIGSETIWPLFVLLLATGSTQAFQTTALNALQADIVGRGLLGNAISLTQLGQRAIGVVGGLTSGFLIGWLGAGSTFLLAALPLLAGAVGFRGLAAGALPRGAAPSTFRSEVAEGLALMVRIPVVRLLLLLMIAVEILGFSWNSLLPAIAEQTLRVGPAGLGSLAAGTSLGSMLGTFVLVATASQRYRGRMLLGVFACFGVLLLGLGLSRVFVISLVVVAGLGATSAMIDALEWTLLQANVPNRLRGRVMGGWIFAVGFGWLGPLSLGALAQATSVGFAVIVAGGLLLTIAALALALAPRLSRGPGRI